MAAEPLFSRRFISTAARVTEDLAERVGALLAAGDVLALDGDLGAGKTTFVRGLARGLGVTAGVSSPTFTLMNSYEGRFPIYHLDAWMADRGDAFLAEGGADWLAGDGVAVIEWAERVEAWLPAGCLRVRLGHADGGPGDAGRRSVTLEIGADPAAAEGSPGLEGGPGAALARRLGRLEPPAGLERAE